MHRGFVSSPTSSWQPVSILVDSGSQQVPLISEDTARRLGVVPSTLSSRAARQADGTSLPLYRVGGLDLAVNGRRVRDQFCSAPIAPYDIILGEDWMHRHAAVLDYSANQLFTRGRDGLQPLAFDQVPASDKCALPDSSGGNKMGKFRSDMGFSGGFSKTPSPGPSSASPGFVIDRAVVAAQQQAWASLSPVSGARAHRLPQRHSQRPNALAVLDFGKELPEDAALPESEVPGLHPSPDSSFGFVERDVKAHLAHLPATQVEEVLSCLRDFQHDVFEDRVMPRLPPYRELDLDITLRTDEPISTRFYPVAPHHLPELRRQMQVLEDAGIIRPSFSPYSAPCLFAPKKDGKLRFCNDYRALNAVTVRDKFPTPTAADLIARTRGAKLFSKIDLHSGFHQLRIREEDIHKTAFSTPFGQYEWVTAPFGLTATPSAFQRLMSHVLRDHIAAGYVVVYLDDVAIFTKTNDPLDHLAKVRAVLESLRQHQLLAKGAKCEFFRTQMEFLGFMVSADGVAPVPGRVDAIRAIPVPETVSQLRSFIGMVNFFRTHIAGFSELASPLTDLLQGTRHGRQRLDWTLECEWAFAGLKEALSSAPVLRHFDPALRTAVHLDASQNAVGAVLLQWDSASDHPHPVAFLSRKLQGPQFRYDGRNTEALAAQIALAHWRPLLYGVHFELVSDHASLGYLLRQKNPSQRILRLAEFLAEFDFDEVKYLKGSRNVVPDFLSRPWDQSHPDVTLHALSHPRLAKSSSLSVLSLAAPRSVFLLPIWGPLAGVFRRGQLFSLPYVRVDASNDDRHSLLGLLQNIPHGFSGEPQLHCICSDDHSSFWCADFSSVPRADSAADDWAFQWRPFSSLTLRESWVRAHFETLRKFGVFQDGSSVHLLSSGISALFPLSVSHVVPSTLLEQLRMGQQADPFLQTVAAGLAEADSDRWRDFFRDTDSTLLCYQRDEDSQPRICVPETCRGEILHLAHGDGALAGHAGVHRTAAAVSRFYYWPNLLRDVTHFVRSCKACAGAKSSPQLRLGVESYSSVPVQPFTHWSMDLIGPLPKSKLGNDMIATWVDRTSKMIVAAAFRSGQSSGRELAALTFKEVCCRFGLPHSLTHDNDVRFKNLWKALWDLLQTKIKCTSAYNPQADPAERANRQILEALRAAVSTMTSFDEWDRALPHICFGLNTHVSSATRMSPFELAHGFPARTPLTMHLPTGGLDPRSRDAFDEALLVYNRHRAASDAVAAAQVRIGRLLDARIRPARVDVGNWVWLDSRHVPHQVPFKLANKWCGPYQVVEVRGATVRLDLPPELGRISPWVNVRRLKFWEERHASLGADDARVDPLLAADGSPRYEIRRILAHRPGRHHHMEYLVSWKGYDITYDKWVPRSVLLADVPQLLASYEANPSVFQPRVSAPRRSAAASPAVPPPPRASAPAAAPWRPVRVQPPRRARVS